MFNGRETTYSEKKIESESFWGDIYIGDFQRQRAIPLQIPFEMTKSALVYAMQSVALDLALVAENYQKQGIEKAELVESPRLDGKNYLQTLYEKAVFARAKNELLPEFASLSARDLHEKRDWAIESQRLLSEATMAIRNLKGKTRGTVILV